MRRPETRAERPRSRFPGRGDGSPTVFSAGRERTGPRGPARETARPRNQPISRPLSSPAVGNPILAPILLGKLRLHTIFDTEDT